MIEHVAGSRSSFVLYDGSIYASDEGGDMYSAIGWEVTNLEFRSVEDGTIFSIPSYALPPEGHPDAGYACAILAPPTEASYTIIQQAVNATLDQRTEETTRTVDISEEVMKVKDLVDRAELALVVYRDSLIALVDEALALKRKRDQIETMSKEAASISRSIMNSTQEMETKRRTLICNAITQSLVFTDLPLLAETMRPVRKADVIEENGKRIIVIELHRFHMRFVGSGYCEYCESSYCECNDRELEFNEVLALEDHVIMINPLGKDFESSIVVQRRDSDRGFDPESMDASHPHVDNVICWYRAALPIAEAWGRRDWESILRLVLTWYTRYNDESPYFAYEHFSNVLEPVNSSGWQIPQEAEVTA